VLEGIPWVKLIIGILFIVVVMRAGLFILRGFATPIPEPPPEGEMRKVNLRYRCSICGAEIRMTVAPTQDPEPPRHCQDEMDLVAPIDD